MRKHIFRLLLLTALASVVLTGVCMTLAYFSQLREVTRDELRRETVYIARLAESGEDIASIPAERRVTLIEADGTVVYDSEADAASMENHASRDEVMAALATGSGESSRFSITTGTNTFYHAERLSDGRVLRLSDTSDSVYELLGEMFPFLLLLVGVLGFGLAWFAGHASKRLVKPLNALRLDAPLETEGFDELAPLLRRLDTQNKTVTRQMLLLDRQRAEFDEITARMSEGLVLLGGGGRVVSLNRRAREIFALDDRDTDGAHYLTLCRDAAFRSAVEHALGGEAAEARLTLGGRIYHMSASPALDERRAGALTGDDDPDARRTAGVALLLQDVTEREQAEQRRRAFTANVSHELKTPLTAISGYAELMEKGIAKPEDVPGFAGRIRAEAARLTSLVEDILRLSRLDEGAVTQPNEQVDLADVAEEVAGALTPRAEQLGVRLDVRGGPCVVNGVRKLLYELCYNLVDNAIGYNKPGGSVTVTTAGRSLTVADTGIGIPAADQPRVFERFYRVDKSRSKETGGTGLGLSIVKNVAQYHGATVELHSAEGVGSVFTVVFPA